MKRTPKPTYSIPADLAWAAAYAAWRINGNLYLKIVDDASGHAQTNKEILMQIVNQTPDLITEQDRIEAQACRSRLGSEISLRILKGEILGEWHTMQARLCGLETFTTAYDLAVLASFPKSYIKLQEIDQIHDRLRQCQDQAVGIGRVTLDIQVLTSFHSVKHGCWFVRGIDDQNRAVSFAWRSQLQDASHVRVSGTVKQFRDGISYLNRVKLTESETA